MHFLIYYDSYPRMSNQNPSSQPEPLNQTIVWQVVVLAMCRLVINTARRFAYPFAPVLSRGLGVPLTAVTSIIAVNQGTAILGILSGPLADRMGYRRMMMAGMALLSVGMLTGGFLPVYGAVFVSLVIAGLGKIVYDPSAQAYIGDHVPYHHRSRVVGILELSWAGCTLAGIPLIGILIRYASWHAPFLAMGGLGIIGFAAIALVLPPDKPSRSRGSRFSTLVTSWRSLSHERTALGAVGFAFFVSIASDNLFVVYGAWMEQSFQLSPVAIGLSTIAIGIAELNGEVFTAFFSDRIGLRRAVLGGIVLSALSYGMLPLVENKLMPALVVLFLIFLFFEYTYVSFMALSTELMPDARATMVAGVYASGGMGRILGALMGIPVWQWGGIQATASVSVLMTVASLIALAWGLKKKRTPNPDLDKPEPR